MNFSLINWKCRGPVIVYGEIFCWPILKSVFLITNMTIFRKSKTTGSNISKDLSLLIYLWKFYIEGNGVIYNIKKICQNPNTSKVFIILNKTKTWEEAWNFPPLCPLFPNPGPTFLDPQLQDCWWVCIILTPSNDLYLMNFC